MPVKDVRWWVTVQYDDDGLNRTELLIFITPRVMDGTGSGTSITCAREWGLANFEDLPVSFDPAPQ